jgi:hypothetical protein
MIRRIVGIAIGLVLVASLAAAQEPARNPRSLGFFGAAWVLGPGVIARGVNAGGGGEPIVARWLDGVGLAVGLGLEAGWGGGELRILAPARELEVRNAAGDRFPHHASQPLVWSIGALIYPIPRLGQGLGRRLRPFVAAGAGGMLVSADLDNREGPSLYHPWQVTLGGGLRLEVGLDDPRAGSTVVEVRLLETHLGAAGPFRRGRATAFSVGLGLRL